MVVVESFTCGAELFERNPTNEEGSETTRVVPKGREMGRVNGRGKVIGKVTGIDTGNGRVNVTGKGVLD